MSSSHIPKWFWIIGVLALIWNLLNVTIFFSDVVLMTPQRLAKMEEPMRAAYENAPQWANISNGIYVCFGTLGSIFLLLKNKLAFPAFTISLAAICIMLVDVFIVSKYYEVLGTSFIIGPIVIFIVGALLVWYSKTPKTKSWLR